MAELFAEDAVYRSSPFRPPTVGREAIRERIDPDSGHGAPASALCANDIGTVVLTLDRPLAFDPYGSQRETASFILIDRETADTAGLGLVLPSHPEPNAERPVPKRSLFTSLFAKLKPKTPARALRGLGVFLVAAASIVAKVTRDRIMDRMHRRYPEFGFDHNMGYGTPDHLEVLDRLGPTPIHRLSFSCVGQPSLPGLGTGSAGVPLP